jgi:hypothetical protein
MLDKQVFYHLSPSSSPVLHVFNKLLILEFFEIYGKVTMWAQIAPRSPSTSFP